MIAVLIASTIGLGVGIIVALIMDPYKTRHGVFMAAGIVVLFAGIGWMMSNFPDPTKTDCDLPKVEVSTPNVKGCMMPDEVAQLDPEVLGR